MIVLLKGPNENSRLPGIQVIIGFENHDFTPALPADNISRGLPTLCGPACAGQVLPALVRWRARRLDHLHAFLSNPATGWLCLRTRANSLVQPAGSDSFACIPAAGRTRSAGVSRLCMAVTPHTRRRMETAGNRTAHMELDRASRRECWAAVLRSLHHGTAAAGLVRAHPAVRYALSALRCVEPGLVPGAFKLSVPGGAVVDREDAGTPLVPGVPRLCPGVRV